jgi:hypothetical protein
MVGLAGGVAHLTRRLASRTLLRRDAESALGVGSMTVM